MATRSVGKDRTAVQRPRRGHSGRTRAGHAPVTEWTSCWNALRSCSVHLAHQGGFPPLQSAPLQAPPSPSPSLFTPVSMRPFLGRLWQPSRCAHESGGPGTAGVLVESVAARICREGGARVATNLLVRDMELRPPSVIDSRRLEVVADGLPVWRRAAGRGHHVGVSSAL